MVRSFPSQLQTLKKLHSLALVASLCWYIPGWQCVLVELVTATLATCYTIHGSIVLLYCCFCEVSMQNLVIVIVICLSPNQLIVIRVHGD